MLKTLDTQDVPPHVVLTGVSWARSEQTLEEIGNKSVRVSFLDVQWKIMSPLPEHEAIKLAISDLIACLATERRIPRKSFGSTTFRLERDETQVLLEFRE